MAIIGKIRSYSGLLIIVIGVALAAFVLGDLFKNSGNRTMPPLAEINGEEITNAEFRKKVDNIEERIRQQNRSESLTPEQNYQAMQMAWNQLLMEEIMREEYEELGLAVKRDPKRQPSISSAELMHLMTSEDAHQFVRQIPAFKDEQGRFQPSRVNQFISMLDQQDAQTKQQWYQLEQEIKKQRLQEKYYNLIGKGYYLPEKMAQLHHKEGNKRVNALLVGMRYRNYSDQEINVTESDYQSYYDEHKKEFERQEPSAKIKYITFDVNPSKDDYTDTREEARNYFEELKKAPKKDVPMLVSTIGENNYDSTYVSKGELPARIDTALFNAEPGTVVPMYQEGRAFKTARLMDVDQRPDSMKASHILIPYAGSARSQNQERTREEAKQLADSLYNVLENQPQKFEQFATNISEDQTAARNGGDLGWFADGQMIPAFNEGVINHNIGETFQVETQFGFHIVKVTDKKEPVKKIKVAQMEIPIEPSQSTYDSVWAQASQFAGSYRTAEEFENAVREQGLSPRTRTISPMEGTIPGIGSSREIARWVFDEETKSGSVSEKVFEGDDTYVVVLVEEKTKEGILPLEAVKDDITKVVEREVRAKELKEKMQKQLQSSGDLTSVARKLGTEVDTLNNLSFSRNNIPKFGPEPKIVGTIVSSPENKIQGPVEGNMGVYAFKVIRVIPAPETNNYARIVQQKQRNFQRMAKGQSGMGAVFNSLKEVSEIEDNRIMYY
ncbi:MAG: peptidylprolyl isomerase [Bacteroidales bacterium]|nr:peptidylprolyl isomerase [Bacteroidales bacterium]